MSLVRKTSEDVLKNHETKLSGELEEQVDAVGGFPDLISC
jgi:hypothetical protein